jgi:hypothetical protein
VRKLALVMKEGALVDVRLPLKPVLRKPAAKPLR